MDEELLVIKGMWCGPNGACHHCGQCGHHLSDCLQHHRDTYGRKGRGRNWRGDNFACWGTGRVTTVDVGPRVNTTLARPTDGELLCPCWNHTWHNQGADAGLASAAHVDDIASDKWCQCCSQRQISTEANTKPLTRETGWGVLTRRTRSGRRNRAR